MFLTDSLRDYSLFAVEESVIKDLLQLFTFELLKRLCAICLRKRRKLSDFEQEHSSLFEEARPRSKTLQNLQTLEELQIRLCRLTRIANIFNRISA